MVPGWAAGGGHSLHVVCDLTIASREHARFKQTDADVGSFDGGFGSAYLARQVGQKFAREIFFLGEAYDAEAAHRMGMVNAVVPGRTAGWRPQPLEATGRSTSRPGVASNCPAVGPPVPALRAGPAGDVPVQAAAARPLTAAKTKARRQRPTPSIPIDPG